MEARESKRRWCPGYAGLRGLASQDFTVSGPLTALQSLVSGNRVEERSGSKGTPKRGFHVGLNEQLLLEICFYWKLEAEIIWYPGCYTIYYFKLPLG
jgi:hypothetical protein